MNAAAFRLIQAARNSNVVSKGLSTFAAGYALQPCTTVFNTAHRYVLPDLVSIRTTSFYAKLTSDELWKGVVSVSNAGRKRGRGKRRSRSVSKNLNKGQIIGIGKINMVWPGLNAPVVRGKEVVQRQKLAQDPEREERLIKLREEGTVHRSVKLSPLERGFSGTSWPGRSIGPPDPVVEETFEGFDTKVLEVKNVFCMTATFGRKRRVSAFVVTGNKNGSAGFALSKSPESISAMRQAKNRAAQRLVFFERYGGHTGYGLVCHRVLRCICQMIGIEDIHAKVQGPMNIQNMTKAFVLGLIRQKTHQMMADEKGLYVVEFAPERKRFPVVVATPTTGVRTEEEIRDDEVLDYDEYITKGRLEYRKPKKLLFYQKLPGWQTHLKKTHPYRNMEDYKVKVLAEHDELTSFILKDPETSGQMTPDVKTE